MILIILIIIFSSDGNKAVQKGAFQRLVQGELVSACKLHYPPSVPNRNGLPVHGDLLLVDQPTVGMVQIFVILRVLHIGRTNGGEFRHNGVVDSQRNGS